MAEVIDFPMGKCFDGPVPPKKMFEGIIKLNNPKHAFVICWPEDGGMPTYHSSTNDAPTILMRLREFEHKYFNGELS